MKRQMQMYHTELNHLVSNTQSPPLMIVPVSLVYLLSWFGKAIYDLAHFQFYKHFSDGAAKRKDEVDVLQVYDPAPEEERGMLSSAYKTVAVLTSPNSSDPEAVKEISTWTSSLTSSIPSFNHR